MRILIAPGAFKGTFTAQQAAERIALLLSAEFPNAAFVLMPMADGGDGTVDVFLANGAEPLVLAATDALGRSNVTTAAVLDKRAVVIELARTCGMHTIDRPAPRTASTLGLGVAMRAAMEWGASELLIGLGGSASTDGGLGMLKGLRGETACGGLDELLETTAIRIERFQIPVTVLADVASPLAGPRGAAFTFGPQKGLPPDECVVADKALSRWAHLLHIDPTTPGAGAAGGAGGALIAMGAGIEPGGAVVAQRIGLAQAMSGANLVVTGEGRLDESTLAGKAPAAVARLAAELGVPCRIVVGSAEPGVANAMSVEVRLLPSP